VFGLATMDKSRRIVAKPSRILRKKGGEKKRGGGRRRRAARSISPGRHVIFQSYGQEKRGEKREVKERGCSLCWNMASLSVPFRVFWGGGERREQKGRKRPGNEPVY